MTFQPLLNCAKVTFKNVIASQACENRMYFLHSGAYLQGDIDQLAIAAEEAWGGFIDPIINPAVSHIETHVRGMNDEFDLESTSDAAAGAGAMTGQVLTAQTSYAVSLRTGYTGRSARGRFYMPPYTATALTNSRTVTSTYQALAVDAIADLIDYILTESAWTAVVAQFVSGGDPLVEGVARIITEVAAANLNIDTQRRRVGK